MHILRGDPQQHRKAGQNFLLASAEGDIYFDTCSKKQKKNPKHWYYSPDGRNPPLNTVPMPKFVRMSAGG
jgi:hypothetical protein